MDSYAVFGNPIAQSQSPFIHRMFAEQTGQSLEYRAILAPQDGFAEAVAEFRGNGGQGANVTMPFKEQAHALCDVLTERARRAGAVNTLSWQADGALLGDNTDGVGLVTDLKGQGVALKGKRILVLGAGGAVRGVLQPLLAEQPAELVVANRTLAKAQALVAAFADLGEVRATGFDAIPGQYDLIINGTATSLSGELPPLPANCLAENGAVYDMAYGKEKTMFQRWGQAQGAALDLAGLGMLVQQAAESFVLWRGVRPDVTPVYQALVAKMEESA